MMRLTRDIHWMSFAAATLALGCGSDHSARERPSSTLDAGDDASRPGEETSAPDPDAATSAADADAASASTGPDAASVLPPERGCAVIRQLSLPNRSPIKRVPGGFVAGLDGRSAGQPRWYAVSEAGGQPVERSAALGGDLSLALLPMGSDPLSGPVVRVSRSTVEGQPHVAGDVLSALGDNPVHDLGPAYYRGSLANGAATSFDGKRGVYVTGHVGVDNLHAFVLNQAGERVGAMVRFMEGNDPITDCLQVIPTQSAALVSYVDRSATPREVQLRWLSEGAEVLERAAVPLDGASCPGFLQATQDAIVLNLEADPGALDLRILRHGELKPLTAQLPPTDGALSLHWVQERAPGDWLALFTAREQPKPILARLRNGEWSLLSAELPPIGGVLPAEPGRLFYTSPASLQADDSVQIYEVACGALDS